MSKEKKEKIKKSVAGSNAGAANGVLFGPWITEKSHRSMEQNKYVFKIFKETEKEQVKTAIKNLYDVTVKDVNIVNIPKKKRVYGRHLGWKSGYKKAIVTLKEGDKIELFQGV